MSKKEKQSMAYIKPIVLDRNKKYLKEDNWELGLEYTDFTGYEVQCAFEAGWDAACEDADGVRGHIKLWKEEFLDKACEWLIEHKEAVETEDNGIMGWIPDYFIEDFRRAMEE